MTSPLRRHLPPRSRYRANGLHQCCLAFVEPVHGCIEAVQRPEQRLLELGCHSSPVEDGQTRLVNESARVFDGFESGRVLLHRQTPSLRNAEVRRQKAGFVHPHGVPRGLLAHRADFQLRDHDAAQTAGIPFAARNHPMPAEDVIPEVFPETRLDARTDVEQRKRAVRVGEPMVRKLSKLNRRRACPMHPIPISLWLASGRNRPLVEINSGCIKRPRGNGVTRHTLGRRGGLPVASLRGSSPVAFVHRGSASLAGRTESSPTRPGAYPG